jgi:hypothetical protein
MAYCAIALLSIGAFAASSAVAFEGPFYRVKCHQVSAANKGTGEWEDAACTKATTTGEFATRLLTGETEAISAVIQKEYVLKAAKDEIKCTAQKLENSTFVGSDGATGSTSEETVVFEGCTVVGNGTPCEPFSEKVVGTPEPGVIRTMPVKNTLDFTNKVPAKGEKLLILFEPTPADKNVFVLVKFKGAGCVIPNTAVEGKVGAEAQDETGAAITAEVNEPKANKRRTYRSKTQIDGVWHES